MRSLPDQPLLDRIVRGRAWIPLLGVMLAGIVAMQVEVLKLGTSIGRSLERGTALQSRNELLRANVAALDDGQRIERLAARTGMVMPAPAAVGFLAGAPRANVQKALTNIHAPNPSSFIAGLPSSSSTSPAGTSTLATPASTGSTATATATAPATSAPTGSTAPTAPVTPGPANAALTAPATAAAPATGG